MFSNTVKAKKNFFTRQIRKNAYYHVYNIYRCHFGTSVRMGCVSSKPIDPLTVVLDYQSLKTMNDSPLLFSSRDVENGKKKLHRSFQRCAGNKFAIADLFKLLESTRVNNIMLIKYQLADAFVEQFPHVKETDEYKKFERDRQARVDAVRSDMAKLQPIPES